MKIIKKLGVTLFALSMLIVCFMTSTMTASAYTAYCQNCGPNSSFTYLGGGSPGRYPCSCDTCGATAYLGSLGNGATADGGDVVIDTHTHSYGGVVSNTDFLSRLFESVTLTAYADTYFCSSCEECGGYSPTSDAPDAGCITCGCGPERHGYPSHTHSYGGVVSQLVSSLTEPISITAYAATQCYDGCTCQAWVDPEPEHPGGMAQPCANCGHMPWHHGQPIPETHTHSYGGVVSQLGARFLESLTEPVTITAYASSCCGCTGFVKADGVLWQEAICESCGHMLARHQSTPSHTHSYGGVVSQLNQPVAITAYADSECTITYTSARCSSCGSSLRGGSYTPSLHMHHFPCSYCSAQTDVPCNGVHTDPVSPPVVFPSHTHSYGGVVCL